MSATRKNKYNRFFSMDWRTTPAHKFRTRLGFIQYDVIIKT